VDGADTQLLARLRAVLEASTALRIAVLFGSRARGRGREGSDVDVGIIPTDPALPLYDELELAARLSEAVAAEVDLVRLDRDDPLLGREVAHTGVCIYESEPGAFSAYRADAVSRWLDFDAAVAPYRARFLARLQESQ
jgi:predicted nucleotidyltransferase